MQVTVHAEGLVDLLFRGGEQRNSQVGLITMPIERSFSRQIIYGVVSYAVDSPEQTCYNGIERISVRSCSIFLPEQNAQWHNHFRRRL